MDHQLAVQTAHRFRRNHDGGGRQDGSTEPILERIASPDRHRRVAAVVEHRSGIGGRPVRIDDDGPNGRSRVRSVTGQREELIDQGRPLAPDALGRALPIRCDCDDQHAVARMHQDEIDDVLAELRPRVHRPLVVEGLEMTSDDGAALVEQPVEMVG